SGALVGLGLSQTYRVARGTALDLRLDWTRRDDTMVELDAIALGGVVSTRLIDADAFELAVGAGPRAELRYGNGARGPTWDRAALAGDVTLDVLPRAMAARVGLRFDQLLTDGGRSSALLVELGFDIR